MPKVLHIDDDESIRDLMQLACSLADDIVLDQAANGTEGLAKAASGRPDLIVLDYMMPDLGGDYVFKRLKGDAGLRHIPVIFMTARTVQKDLQAMRELGAVDVWTKPFDPFELPVRIGALIDRDIDA